MAIDFPNFYENLEEASKRLSGTYVLYDGRPYRILTITNHKTDGIFRAYLLPLGDKEIDYIPDYDMFSEGSPDQAKYLDEWMEKNSEAGVLRKHLNSPLFNRFRPYPLGMCNYKGYALYLERQPMRPRMEQGLVPSGIVESPLSLLKTGNGRLSSGTQVKLNSDAFRDCVLGVHPSAQECVERLNDSRCGNDAVAFDRYFALVRGPVDMTFLAYKGDVIGLLPDNNLSSVRLSKKFSYAKEVVQELGVFQNVA